jgi:hypothetical protein
MKSGRIILGVAVGFVFAGCGGDDSAGASSGVDGTKQLSALSAGEIGSFCDWAAAKYGGYGKRVNCGLMSYSVWSDQADCSASFSPVFSHCAHGTAAQEEACLSKLAASPCFGRDNSECRTLDTACQP